MCPPCKTCGGERKRRKNGAPYCLACGRERDRIRRRARGIPERGSPEYLANRSAAVQTICAVHDEEKVQVRRGERSELRCRSCHRDYEAERLGHARAGSPEHLAKYDKAWHSAVVRGTRERGIRTARERIDAKRAAGSAEQPEVGAELDAIADRVRRLLDFT